MGTITHRCKILYRIIFSFRTALSHHYESKCIDINKHVDVSGTDEGREPTKNIRSIESYIGGDDEKDILFEKYDLKVAMAMKLAHLKEAVASHEETQRLQRMCRHLKVSVFDTYFLS